MEKLQGVNVAVYFHHWCVKRESVVDYIFQRSLVYVISKEGLCHFEGNLLKRHGVYVVKESLGQWSYVLRHVQSAVWCEAFFHGFAKRCRWGLVVCAIIFHVGLVLFCLVVYISMNLSMNSVR